MTDWRELKGAGLRRYIAERLGWRVVEHDVTPDVHGVGYWLQRPDGTFAYDDNRVNRWKPEHFFMEEGLVPDWPHNLTDALRLWDDVTDAQLAIIHTDGDVTPPRWLVTANFYIAQRALYHASVDTLDEVADHAARAWCAYDEAKGRGE